MERIRRWMRRERSSGRRRRIAEVVERGEREGGAR
jgi:hypothetical protein